MEKEVITQAIEAILFINGDPVSFQRLGKGAGCSAKEAAQACEALQSRLDTQKAGLALIINGDAAQLATRSELASAIESFVKKDAVASLPPAALETLSLVAYFAPVSRAEIEYVRGVNSSFTIRNLLMRGLIERIAGEKGTHGQNLYRASNSLLQFLGIQHIKELPAYQEYRKLLEEYRSQSSKEEA